MEMGLQTEDRAPGAERHILVWHGGGGDRGTAEEGWMAQTSQHQSLRSCSSHADVYIALLTFAPSFSALAYICVHIDVNLPLCMDLYLYETVILFPCRPCVQLSTATTKTR